MPGESLDAMTFDSGDDDDDDFAKEDDFGSDGEGGCDDDDDDDVYSVENEMDVALGSGKYFTASSFLVS